MTDSYGVNKVPSIITYVKICSCICARCIMAIYLNYVYLTGQEDSKQEFRN